MVRGSTFPPFRDKAPKAPGPDATGRSPLPPPAREGAFTFAEVMITIMITAVMSGGILAGLLGSQRFASKARLLTNARAIVERNLDQALGVPFTSGTTPAILKTTSSSGEIWDDDGVNDSQEKIAILRKNNNVLVSGTLRRTVVQETLPSGVSDVSTIKVLRVTFRVDYTYLSKLYSYSATTLRSQDNQL